MTTQQTGEDRSVEPLPVNVDRLRAHLIHAHSFCGQCQGFAAALDVERATRASTGAGLDVKLLAQAMVLRRYGVLTTKPNPADVDDATAVVAEYTRLAAARLAAARLPAAPEAEGSDPANWPNRCGGTGYEPDCGCDNCRARHVGLEGEMQRLSLIEERARRVAIFDESDTGPVVADALDQLRAALVEAAPPEPAPPAEGRETHVAGCDDGCPTCPTCLCHHPEANRPPKPREMA